MLVYAHRGGTPENERMGEWLETLLNGSAPVGLASLVLSGVLRIVTHPRVFSQPTPLATALEFVESLRGSPNTVEVAPGPRHWKIFAAPRERGATAFPMPISRRSRSSRAASGLRQTGTSPASKVCAGAIRLAESVADAGEWPVSLHLTSAPRCGYSRLTLSSE